MNAMVGMNELRLDESSMLPRHRKFREHSQNYGTEGDRRRVVSMNEALRRSRWPIPLRRGLRAWSENRNPPVPLIPIPWLLTD